LVTFQPLARPRVYPCVALVKKYGFDGLDIDWEYPVTGGKPTDHKREGDKDNFVLLLKQMRVDLDAFSPEHHLLLTIASTCYRDHGFCLLAVEPRHFGLVVPMSGVCGEIRLFNFSEA
jgi:Glycosyl hydrolases family 18